MAKAAHTFTILEDQPNSGRWDVEIRTFTTYKAAESFLKRRYTAEERNGECDNCRPWIRNDADVVEAA